MTRNSCWPLPAFLMVRVASLTVWPSTPFMINSGDELSTFFVSTMSCTHTAGTAPRLVLPVPVDVPHDHDSTSIQSLCLSSTDSPLMSPIFRNISLADTTVVDGARLAATKPAATRPLKPLLFI